MKCPAENIRPELKDLPLRMLQLPLDYRGYPVPWFVGKVNGEWDFRFMDQEKWIKAVRQKLCWVCGQKLGTYLAFVIGPMCAITRTTTEPHCHRACATWSCKYCPFLSRPHMVRREDELTKANEGNVAGYALLRNPGVSCLWLTAGYKVFEDDKGSPLISVGDPVEVEWYAEGRFATRAEIEESIRTGLPKLEELARADRPGSIEQLMKQVKYVETLLPL